MSIPIRFAAAILGVAIYSSAVPAQQHPSPPVQPDARTIILNVVVAPKSSKPVPGLKQQEFSVLDNNVAQPITSFAAISGQQPPVEIVLVVDAVNLDFNSLAYERGQIDKFLRSDGGRLTHPIALAVFTDSGIQLQHAPSTDGNQLSASLDQSDIGLREIRRDSQFGEQDRINLSLNALHSLAAKESERPGRKLIFWISPGWPLLSGPRVDLDSKQQQSIYAQVVGISNLLRHGDITLYSIDPLGTQQNVAWEFYYQEFLKGVAKPSQVQLGDLALQVIAIQSGGRALTASNDIAHGLEQCMADTAAYYRISYEPPPTDHGDGAYHKVDIKVPAPGLTARTLTGYYDEP